MQQQHRDALINKINLNVLEEKGIGGGGRKRDTEVEIVGRREEVS